MLFEVHVGKASEVTENVVFFQGRSQVCMVQYLENMAGKAFGEVLITLHARYIDRLNGPMIACVSKIRPNLQPSSCIHIHTPIIPFVVRFNGESQALLQMNEGECEVGTLHVTLENRL